MLRRYLFMGEERITLRSVFGPYRKGKYWKKDIADAIEKNDYLEGKATYYKWDAGEIPTGVGEGRVLVDYTKTSFGGYRLWLVCERCHKKRTYLIGHDDIIKCRECWGLVYASQYGNHLEKPFVKYWKLHDEFSKRVDSSRGYFSYAGKPTKRTLKIQRAFEAANAAMGGFRNELDKPDYFTK